MYGKRATGNATIIIRQEDVNRNGKDIIMEVLANRAVTILVILE